MRLNSNLLQHELEVLCDPSYLKIALLNFRYILAKLPDITTDKSLRSADFLCFCETWLNASQPTTLLLNNKADIRRDTITNENRGGVLICVPSYTNPTSVHRFTATGIEAVSATIDLGADSLQIAVVYRSPSVAQTTQITLLTRLLTHLTISALTKQTKLSKQTK